ncbi:MAG TPA: hypothetical protein VK524_01095, partial [Polyangiaceae bacterium]|nr:hypothetical protein [Polyangiaceae bacterium]
EPTLHTVEPEDGRALVAWTRQIDFTLGEAVQDLGLKLDVSGRATVSVTDLTEDNLISRADDSWVVSPRLEIQAGRVRLRILAVPPGSKVLLVRSQEVEAREAELRAMVMMRDLISIGRGSPASDDQPDVPRADDNAIVYSARSAGRAILALNAAALGGYVGYTIQRASDSSDDRLTYPLIALGTGIGLGASMIVADEWDVGLGDAWYLSAGAIWPGVAGFLLADGYDETADEDRFVLGVVGATAGIALATTALTFRGMGEGGALLTHSGGAFGLFLGGLTELAYEGSTDETPSRGMGYGAGAGVLAAGVLATQFQLPPSRVLLIDLGASVGALTGAAAGSPLLIVDDQPSKGRDRAWLGGVALGTLAGGAVGWYITRSGTKSGSKKSESEVPPARPSVGVVGMSTTPEGQSAPVFGAGVSGIW